MQIRAARIEDAPQACVVVRRSITELCLADYQDDPATLQKWLANKTPANLSLWIAKPDNHMFVATDGDAILGVACVTSCGEVTLNYVSPDVRFRLMPVAGRDDLWVEVSIPEGEQGVRWIPPHEFTGRLERLDSLGHRHRGLRASLERQRSTPLPAETFVIVNGDLPSGNRWAIVLAGLFAVSILYNGLMAARLLRSAR